MQKYTEKVHCAEEDRETVWVRSLNANECECSVSVCMRDGYPDGDVEAIEKPIVYSKRYGVNFVKLEKLHPFDAAKGKNIAKLLQQAQLVNNGKFYEPQEITKEGLLKVHTERYIQSLNWSLNAAKIAEIPLLAFVPNFCVQRGYLKPMRYQTAGSILAAKLAIRHGWAINLGGGFHHCCSNKGGGFCPYADITLLIQQVFAEENDITKVMIVDLDAHQGNGHERDFLNNDKVYIMDMYNCAIYPRDHTAKLAIKYAVELLPRTGDQIYLKKLTQGLTKSFEEFHPELVVYNAGTDILLGDPLGHLSITPQGVIERDRLVFSKCRSLNIPIVMLLSGGYLKASAKVIADSIINLKNQNLLDMQTLHEH